eukprot:11115467-Lingulodinium_polyedra.AAC.1
MRCMREMAATMPIQSVPAADPRQFHYGVDLYCEDERLSLRHVGTSVQVADLHVVYKVTYDD